MTIRNPQKRLVLRLAPVAAAALLIAFALGSLGAGRSNTLGGNATAGRTLDDFAQKFALRVASPPGATRLVLRGDGVDLTLAPGLPYARVNGRVHRLDAAPAVWQGRLRIPTAVEALLPRPVRQEARRASMRAHGAVILDAGHGGKDSGAVANGLQEKDIALDIARRTGAYLRAWGATVAYTRRDDTFVSLQGRAHIANRMPGAVFVSIHLNATAGRTSREKRVAGVETFVLTNRISDNYRVGKASRAYRLEHKEGDAASALSSREQKERIRTISALARRESRLLADRVQTHLVAVRGRADRGVKEKNLAVLRENYFGPAILTELGFLTNAATARELNNPTNRDRIARALAAGIADYLNAP